MPFFEGSDFDARSCVLLGLRGMRLEVMGVGKNGAREGDTHYP